MENLPAGHLAHVRSLEDAYLRSNDPIKQAGFSGGPKRWRREREPILTAIDDDGDLLDVGCANGYLLECLLAWAAERGIQLVPYGVDIGPRLIDVAKRRLPRFADNFWAANGWDWRPGRRFRYVYTLWDCVPPEMLGEYARRLLTRTVEPGGRLIIGAYGSRSRAEPPIAIGDALESCGMVVAGRAQGGDPVVTLFAWIDG